MAFLWADADWDLTRLALDRAGSGLIDCLRETPAGVLLAVGLATMWVGWLVGKRKPRD
jgi:hypothetical protein